MVKIVLYIEGMGCGHCENSVNNAIKGKYAVEKVTSSHEKGTTEILCNEAINEAELKELIAETGFKMVGYSCEEQKKGFRLFGRK